MESEGALRIFSRFLPNYNVRDLTAKELLLKCLYGRTQNPNESFNNSVSGIVCRKTFVSKRTLQMGVMDAVICFNEGAYARTEVLKALKNQSRQSTLVKAFVKLTTSEFGKLRLLFKKLPKSRTTKRQIKRKQDALEQSMQDEYSAGNFRL
ncbi:uncharacterized protein TNCV_2013021 [Trichonephila clavipes]|nr:uncharacterized protein TNCV_2013021 [Trichonephila clavipes]